MKTTDKAQSLWSSLWDGMLSTLHKMRTPFFMLVFATSFLIAFVVLGQFDTSANLLFALFLCAPILMVAFAYIVVRHGVFDGRELEEGEEFGYEDYDHENGRFTRSLGEVFEQLKDSQS